MLVLVPQDFFNEPSQASLTCAITGPINIKNMDNIRGGDGREIFAERKNVFNLLQNKVQFMYFTSLFLALVISVGWV